MEFMPDNVAMNTGGGYVKPTMARFLLNTGQDFTTQLPRSR